MRVAQGKKALLFSILILAGTLLPSFDVGASTSKVAIYRFYHYSTGSHFFTTSESEKERVITQMASKYRFEGYKFAGWTDGNSESRVPVARFYKKSTGTHFYTISPTETSRLKQTSGFRYEGIAYYGQKDFTATDDIDGQCPVVRFYNFTNGTHFYTSSLTETDRLSSYMYDKFRYEGIAYIAWDGACNWFY